MSPDGSDKEIGHNPQPLKFKKTHYSEGYFETDGTLVLNPFNKDQLNDWERIDKKFGYKLFGRGQKLFLPTEKNTNFTLIFGRDQNTCDVVIDADIVGNYWEREVSVSRKHFKIEKRQDGKWEVADLGSTNGLMYANVNDLRINFVDLKNSSKPRVLNNGDILLIGGAPGTVGRLIGFVFNDGKQGYDPFLTKFNATSIANLAIVTGRLKKNPELFGKFSNEDINKGVKGEVHESGEHLIELYTKLEGRKKDRENESLYFNEAHQFCLSVLTTVKRLGDEYYHGHWTMAADDIGTWAFQKSETIMKKNPDGDDLDKTKRATEYLKLSNYLMDLATKFGLKASKK